MRERTTAGAPAAPWGLEAALDSLRADGTRARAALLCVASGAAVIVALVSIVSGGRKEMLRAVEAAGPSNVLLRASSSGAALTMADVDAARSRLPRLVASGGVRAGTHPLRSAGLLRAVPVHAVSEGTAGVFAFRADAGRGLGALDFRSRARHAVAGAALARVLAEAGVRVGSRLEAGGETYELVGTLRPLPTDVGSGADLLGIDWDRGLLVPLGAEPCAPSVPDDDYPIALGLLRLESPAEAARARRLLAELGSARGAAAQATTPGQALEQYRAARRSFDRVAVLVAALCTASAALGVTNLLRASVKSRAAEIGLRRALGARRADIRRQFLLEGLLLGAGGGVLGILVGVGAAFGLLSRAGWRPSFDVVSLLAMTAGSALLGVASGIRPAVDAARLDPGAALRAE